jgi:hypothetical protein
MQTLLALIKTYFNRSAIRAVLITGGVAGGVLVIVWTLHKLFNIPMEEFVLDPSEIMKAPFYFGVMSNMGIVLWGIASALGIFSFIALSPAAKQLGSPRLMLALSLFTLLLMADDQLRIHENIFGHYLNIRERYVFITYFVIILVISAVYWRSLLASDLLILAAVVFFLASSTIIDQTEIEFAGEALVEEGGKFIGIVFWLVYMGRLALVALRKDRQPG